MVAVQGLRARAVLHGRAQRSQCGTTDAVRSVLRSANRALDRPCDSTRIELVRIAPLERRVEGLDAGEVGIQVLARIDQWTQPAAALAPNY